MPPQIGPPSISLVNSTTPHLQSVVGELHHPPSARLVQVDPRLFEIVQVQTGHVLVHVISGHMVPERDGTFESRVQGTVGVHPDMGRGKKGAEF